jgi:hypothetical protein
MSGEAVSKISIKGVLIGAIIDTFASAIFGILVAIIVVLMSHLTHIPRQVFHRHGLLYLAMLMAGLVFSTIGGYVSAWLARHNELLNGGLSSFLCVLVSIFYIAIGKDTHPLFLQVIPLVTVPVFAVLGGYLRLCQKVQYATKAHKN